MNATPDRSPIFAAVLASDYDALRQVTKIGHQLDQRDDLGMTPLLYAIYRGDLDAVRILLELGANPNLPQLDDPSCTPLWHAEDDFGLTEIAQLLRSYGAVL
jgi:ankyrin repeat protein